MAVGAILGVFVVTLVVLGVWYKRRQRKREAASNPWYLAPSPFHSSQNSGIFLNIMRVCLLPNWLYITNPSFSVGHLECN